MRAAAPREPTFTEIQIEQSVVALLFEGDETAWFVLDQANQDDLLEPVHQRMFEAARRVLGAGAKLTILTLGAAMASDPGLDKLGGTDYFRHIQNQHGRNSVIALDLCNALADQAQRRSIAYEIAQTESRLRDASVSAGDILADHENAIRSLAEGKPQADEPLSWYDAGVRVMEAIESREIMPPSLLSFGINAIDDAVGGMGPGDLVILAGRPGMGKTALALVIAHGAAKPKEQIRLDLEPSAVPQSVGVFFSSLEMKHDALLQRGLSMRAYDKGCMVPYSQIRMNRIQESGHIGLAQALVDDTKLPILIDQRRGLTVGQIGVRARRAQAHFRRSGIKLGLLVVDHLGLIEGDGAYRGNKVAEITATTKSLKNLAGALDIPILCLSQLSRKVEERDDKRPFLSDLRDSGSIEQDADVVMFVHRMEYYLQKSKPDETATAEKRSNWDTLYERSKGKLNVIVAKNRNGAEADISLKCDMAYNWIGGPSS